MNFGENGSRHFGQKTPPEEVPCLQGDDARKAFDDMHYEESIRFYDGSCCERQDICLFKGEGGLN